MVSNNLRYILNKLGSEWDQSGCTHSIIILKKAHISLGKLAVAVKLETCSWSQTFSFLILV